MAPRRSLDHDHVEKLVSKHTVDDYVDIEHCGVVERVDVEEYHVPELVHVPIDGQIKADE
jgi:hypothetical protein